MVFTSEFVLYISIGSLFFQPFGIFISSTILCVISKTHSPLSPMVLISSIATSKGPAAFPKFILLIAFLIPFLDIWFIGPRVLCLLQLPLTIVDIQPGVEIFLPSVLHLAGLPSLSLFNSIFPRHWLVFCLAFAIINFIFPSPVPRNLAPFLLHPLLAWLPVLLPFSILHLSSASLLPSLFHCFFLFRIYRSSSLHQTSFSCLLLPLDVRPTTFQQHQLAFPSALSILVLVLPFYSVFHSTFSFNFLS